jgi:DNA polymerase-3 subunit alpha
MGFLKSRFKFEFYTALLEFSISSQITLKKYIDEVKLENIEIIPPSINLSELRVTNKNKKIIFPFQIIKGFGTFSAKKLLEERKKGKFIHFFDFVSRLNYIGFGESTLELLIKSNSLIEFGNMQSLLDSLPLALRYTNLITINKNKISILDKNTIKVPNLIISERNISDEIFNEKKLFGFQLNAFITSEKENENKLLYLEPGDRKEVIFLVERIRKIMTKNNKRMAKMIISDSTATLNLIVFPDVFKFVE